MSDVDAATRDSAAELREWAESAQEPNPRYRGPTRRAADNALALLAALERVETERDALAEQSDGLYAAVQLFQADRDRLAERCSTLTDAAEKVYDARTSDAFVAAWFELRAVLAASDTPTGDAP